MHSVVRQAGNMERLVPASFVKLNRLNNCSVLCQSAVLTSVLWLCKAAMTIVQQGAEIMLCCNAVNHSCIAVHHGLTSTNHLNEPDMIGTNRALVFQYVNTVRHASTLSWSDAQCSSEHLVHIADVQQLLMQPARATA